MNKEQITAEVLAAFALPEGQLKELAPYGSGHINDTFRVTYETEKRQRRYILQRMNKNIFEKPVELMENIVHVTEWIKKKSEENGGDPERETLTVVCSRDGKPYYLDSEGQYWRIYLFVEGTTSYDQVEKPSDFYESAVSFGHFQRMLADFPAKSLHETIPDFHNTRKRLNTLFEHVEKDPCNRVHEVPDEIAYLSFVSDKAAELSELFANGEIPRRVTHNDTKANNVLFDKVTKEPLVVIDLDTIMPGMSMYDFGDAVRFIANTSAEDEPDTSKVFFDTGKFRAFAKGFIRETKDLLTEVELKNLVKASFSITVEQASRFLDDCLTGDHYFRYEYPKHNLVRARCQLQLAKDIEKKWSELEWIIQDVIDQLGNN